MLRGIMVCVEVTANANKTSSFKQVSTFQRFNPEISTTKPNTNHKESKPDGPSAPARRCLRPSRVSRHIGRSSP
jgi:hypothetical protein